MQFTNLWAKWVFSAMLFSHLLYDWKTVSILTGIYFQFALTGVQLSHSGTCTYIQWYIKSVIMYDLIMQFWQNFQVIALTCALIWLPTQVTFSVSLKITEVINILQVATPRLCYHRNQCLGFPVATMWLGIIKFNRIKIWKK